MAQLGKLPRTVISSFLIRSNDWRCFHWLISIVAGVDLILIFFSVPETQHPRYSPTAFDAVTVTAHAAAAMVEESDEQASIQTCSKSEGVIGSRRDSRRRDCIHAFRGLDRRSLFEKNSHHGHALEDMSTCLRVSCDHG